jgi:Leucine-rich repeat (LRR) protein
MRKRLPPVDTTGLWAWGLPKDDSGYGTTVAPRVAAANAKAVRTVEEARTSKAREIHLGLVDELPPLTALPHLRRLDLSCTRITNIEPVGQLSGLKHLSVDRTRVVDLSPVAGLRQLTGLNLAKTDISNLDALAELTNLEWLNIEHTSVTDLRPLANLPKLQMLRMSRSAVSDVGPLAGLPNLEYLDISATQVSDLSPLATLVCLVGAALSPESNVYGLYYEGCPLSDPVLLELADRDTPERTFETIRYLRRKQGIRDMDPSIAKLI